MPISPNALDAERIDDVVLLVDEDHLDVVHVGIHRHMILGDVGIHDATEAVVDQRFLVQRHADAPDHAAHDLAVRGLGVQDAPGRDRADDASDADDAELLVHLHLGKDRRMRVLGVCPSLLESCGFLLFDAIHAAVAHGIRDRYGAGRIRPAGDHAIGESDVFHAGVRERRVRHCLRQTQQLVAHGVGGRHDPVRIPRPRSTIRPPRVIGAASNRRA